MRNRSHSHPDARNVIDFLLFADCGLLPGYRFQMSISHTLRLILRAGSFARPYRIYLAVVLCLTLLIAVAGSVEPLVMKYIFDALGRKETALPLLMTGVGGLVVLGVAREVLQTVSNWLSWRTRLNIHYSLLDATVERIHRLPPDYHRENGVGAIMTRLDRSIQGFIGALSEISFSIVPSIAYLVLALVMMLRLDWRMTLLVAAFAPVPALIAAFAAPAQVVRERTLLDRWSRIYSRFNEVLGGIVTVRSFAMENTEKMRFLDAVDQTNRIVVRGIRYDSGVGAIQNLVILLARIAAIGFGGYLVVIGQITVGTVIAFLGYVNGLFGPLQGLTSIYRVLRTATVSLEQVFEILDTENPVKDAPDAVDPSPFKGKVRFDRVGFGYNRSEPILQSITTEVRPGEMVAIVGPSGAGKTTLMALMQRFFDPVTGTISVDGMDLRTLKQDALRRQIGVVLQDALLFNESIRDNIAYGRPDASQEEIEAAARIAHAHEFISRLEQDYYTVVGERGARLSAGERQRIAIARAILKNPPILIFDEATSALDAETEALVQEAFEDVARGRTTFVIAHRLATVVRADRILVIKDGRIVEQGTHGALCRRQGYYANLVDRQTRGLLLAA